VKSGSGEAKQLAFAKLKELITLAPVLAFPEDLLMYWVEADLSDFTTGTTISQQSSEDGKWHPIAFLYQSLSPVEMNYEIHNKEMLTIIQALEEWRHFFNASSRSGQITIQGHLSQC